MKTAVKTMQEYPNIDFGLLHHFILKIFLIFLKESLFSVLCHAIFWFLFLLPLLELKLLRNDGSVRKCKLKEFRLSRHWVNCWQRLEIKGFLFFLTDLQKAFRTLTMLFSCGCDHERLCLFCFCWILRSRYLFLKCCTE